MIPNISDTSVEILADFLATECKLTLCILLCRDWSVSHRYLLTETCLLFSETSLSLVLLTQKTSIHYQMMIRALWQPAASQMFLIFR